LLVFFFVFRLQRGSVNCRCYTGHGVRRDVFRFVFAIAYQRSIQRAACCSLAGTELYAFPKRAAETSTCTCLVRNQHAYCSYITYRANYCNGSPLCPPTLLSIAVAKARRLPDTYISLLVALQSTLSLTGSTRRNSKRSRRQKMKRDDTESAKCILAKEEPRNAITTRACNFLQG
jgi:hypothetical protein